MTYPRIIVPGATHLVTRRTILRHHLFAPSPQVRQLFLYSLAVAAARYGVEVHAAVLMSTHEHIVLTDVRGELPAFLQYFHRIVALATKVLRKWEGPVWDHEKTSVVELLTSRAVVEKMAYAIANPVAAKLVRRAEEWPGPTVRVAELGSAEWRIERPTFFFDPESHSWPTVAVLRLTLPQIAFEFGPLAAIREIVADEVARIEKEALRNAKAAGHPFLGPDRCRNVTFLRRATSMEPVRALDPSFAVGRGREADRMAAKMRLRAFRAAYREALAAWRAGNRRVYFPAGTWLMPRFHSSRAYPPRHMTRAAAAAASDRSVWARDWRESLEL